MEVPVIHRINDFQIASSSLAGLQSVSAAYNFCKWSALILALLAAFGSIVNRIKILILRLHHHTQSLTSTNLLTDLNLDLDDYTSGSDGDDDDASYSSPSTVSSSDYEEDEQAEPSRSSQWRRVSEDFQVRGSGHHRRRCSIGDIFSLSEIANSDSVVKLWDSIGFGLGLDFDLDDHHELFSSAVAGERASAPAHVKRLRDELKVYNVEASSSMSPAVVVSAGEGVSGNLAVAVWDTRLRRRTPAVIAEWEGNEGRVVGVGSGGVEKVYVKDDVRYGVRVGDMRKVTAPLGDVTECDLDTWCPASLMSPFLRRK